MVKKRLTVQFGNCLYFVPINKDIKKEVKGLEIKELDNRFIPKTELGKAMKLLVENGDHCDGNIYWLIQLLEQKQEEISHLRKQNNLLIKGLKLTTQDVEWGESLSVHIDKIKRIAVETLNNHARS